MRYKTWIEDSQKMTRKIKFDLQFFVPHRLRLMMVADTTPLNKDFVHLAMSLKETLSLRLPAIDESFMC
jgi:hypothetical protein